MTTDSYVQGRKDFHDGAPYNAHEHQSWCAGWDDAHNGIGPKERAERIFKEIDGDPECQIFLLHKIRTAAAAWFESTD